MATLTDDEIRDVLAELPGWELVDATLCKEFRLDGFPAAVAFVVRLSYDAQAADHHPDLDIRYNKVRVALSTHSEGGITAKDVAMAKAVEAVAR
jgi:4a-hydroxytetrahydrobiopterin dehydratase